MIWLIKSVLVLVLLCVVMIAADDSPPPLPPPSPLAPVNPKFNPSTAIIMVALVSAFFLLGFFSVYIRQCAVTRFGGAGGFSLSPEIGGGGGDGRRSRVAARGLDVTVLATFPTFVYSYVKGLKIGKDVLECAVCLNEFEDDETLRFIPKCNHVFHMDCIDAWLGGHATCPVCRSNLVPEPGETVNPVSTIQQSDPESDYETNVSNISDSPTIILVKSSPETSMRSTGHNRPHRAKSTGFRLTKLFARSHTTGHSVGQNYDRFTLVLPEDVRNQILNASLNRARSCVEFPRVRSTKQGFRSNSTGGKNSSFYERFNHDQNRSSSRQGLSVSPSFLSRIRSIRPSHNANGAREVPQLESSKSVLFRSLKSPFDRRFLGIDHKDSNVGTNVGERSSDRLRDDSQVSSNVV